MSDLNIEGTIKVIGDTQEFDSGFKKRQFVISTAAEYPQDLAMQFYRDKVDILDKYKVGEKVTVWFNLGGNEHNGKYYVNLAAWRIAKVLEPNFEGIQQEKPEEKQPAEQNDGLPF